MGREFSSVLILSLVCLASASPVIMQARDSNPGCQKASFGDFTWTIANLELHSSSSHHDNKDSIAFTLANPALTYTGSCSANANEHGAFSGDIPYPCVFPGISTSTSATFLFNEATGLLNITQAWVCSDQDPRYPCVLFFGCVFCCFFLCFFFFLFLFF